MRRTNMNWNTFYVKGLDHSYLTGHLRNTGTGWSSTQEQYKLFSLHAPRRKTTAEENMKKHWDPYLGPSDR